MRDTELSDQDHVEGSIERASDSIGHGNTAAWQSDDHDIVATKVGNMESELSACVGSIAEHTTEEARVHTAMEGSKGTRSRRMLLDRSSRDLRPFGRLRHRAHDDAMTLDPDRGPTRATGESCQLDLTTAR